MRRYLAAFDDKGTATAELHYQVSFGTKMLVYDSLRGQSQFIERDPPALRGGAAVKDMGQISWRVKQDVVKVTKALPENTIRGAMRDVLGDGQWHTLDDLADAIRHVATEEQAIMAFDRALRAARAQNKTAMTALLREVPIEEGFRLLARESVQELDVNYTHGGQKKNNRTKVERRTQYRWIPQQP